jgi:hypothetical protein
MNKVVVGVVITIIAVGALIGIVVVNHNNKKPAAKNTSSQSTPPDYSNSYAR